MGVLPIGQHLIAIGGTLVTIGLPLIGVGRQLVGIGLRLVEIGLRLFKVRRRLVGLLQRAGLLDTLRLVPRLIATSAVTRHRRSAADRSPVLSVYVTLLRPPVVGWGVPAATPTPISRKSRASRMRRCGGLAIHSATITAGVADVPLPQASASPACRAWFARR